MVNLLPEKKSHLGMVSRPPHDRIMDGLPHYIYICQCSNDLRSIGEKLMAYDGFFSGFRSRFTAET